MDMDMDMIRTVAETRSPLLIIALLLGFREEGVFFIVAVNGGAVENFFSQGYTCSVFCR